MKINSSHQGRKGVALIMALVLMAVLTVILSVVTLQIVSQRQLMQQRQRQYQAQWLARAGVELAAARLIKTPAGFKEENTGLMPDAKVYITVEKTEPDLYLVTTESTLGSKEDKSIVGNAQERFRRVEKQSGVVLKAIGAEIAP
jgi:Tfp pilus assembly protein PilX